MLEMYQENRPARALTVVSEAHILPERAARRVVDRAGEVSIAAVREAFDPGDLATFRERALEAPESGAVVVAALEGPELSMVEEAAQRASVTPGRWLQKAVRETVESNPPPNGYTSLEQQIEDSIFKQHERELQF